jgi:hypothetical protein
MVSTLVVSLGIVLAPAPVAVEPLPFEPDALGRSERVTIRVVEEGKATSYEGVPLARALGDRLGKENDMAALRALADAVILVRASDGYQVAVSAAEVAMDPKGERFLLALSRDGRPLGDGQGPVRLIVPGDPKRVRWVRMVTSLHLVRLSATK